MSHTNASVFGGERPHAEPATTTTATLYIYTIMDGTRSHSHSSEHEWLMHSKISCEKCTLMPLHWHEWKRRGTHRRIRLTYTSAHERSLRHTHRASESTKLMAEFGCDAAMPHPNRIFGPGAACIPFAQPSCRSARSACVSVTHWYKPVLRLSLTICFFFFLVRLRSRISLGRSAHAERSPVVRPGRNAIWLRPRQWHAHTDISVRRHSMLHVQSETSLKPIRMCFLFAARRTQWMVEKCKWNTIYFWIWIETECMHVYCVIRREHSADKGPRNLFWVICEARRWRQRQNTFENCSIFVLRMFESNHNGLYVYAFRAQWFVKGEKVIWIICRHRPDSIETHCDVL